MKWSLLVCVAAVVSIEASPFGDPLWSYHDSVGIPMAAHLKKVELEANMTRIVGGTSVAAGAHPFMVGIVITLFTPVQSMCGASLLTNTRSLTAAHCWYDGSRWARFFTMVFGSRTLHVGGVRIDTSNIDMHPNWNTANFNNDIAIVRHNRVGYNNIIGPIRLPTGQQNNDFVGTWAMAIGYGRTRDGQAPTFNPDKREARLQVITNTQCARSFSSFIIPSTLCTTGPRGVNICQGDSGGPLAMGTGNNRVLIGVISFGSNLCEAGQPSGYARVTSYLPWITARI